MVRLFAIITIIATVTAQQCTVADQARTDCGYFGINQQQCEAKSCCWRPTNVLGTQDVTQPEGGIPWCFFPSGQNPCESINFSGDQGPGFDAAFYSKMYQLFDANINIQGKGGVVAAPDPSTPGGSYYYHWMRDAALTIRTYMEINDFDLSKIEEKVKAYVGWVKRVQNEVDPNGFDIRINPKFELPNGEVFMGGWCRPQTDGPGLRSGALLMFADLLWGKGQQSYVTENIIPLIKFDLDWVFNKWSSEGCDLWEEVKSSDFFWNRNSYIYTLDLCQSFFQKIGDSSTVSKCASTRSAVFQTLDGHWTGTFMTESSNRQKDSAVIHAFSSFNAYPLTDAKIAKTIQTLSMTFCGEYQINQQANKNGVPGILLGRYPGDSYAGGNPWQLLTAVLAKIFYQGAQAMMEQKGFLMAEDQSAWGSLLKVEPEDGIEAFVEAAIKAGDTVMYRMYQYVKGDNGHIAEQIGRNSGLQTSAKDLTWSYANILSAMRTREKAKAQFEQFRAQRVIVE